VLRSVKFSGVDDAGGGVLKFIAHALGKLIEQSLVIDYDILRKL
jgi:hypothetical protein